jgi:anaerobic ribonucleoside-triphosphate reductase activating protein
MTSIALSRLHFPITTLGPGRRLGIWLQGCSIRCPGCISVDTWSTSEGLTTTDSVIEALRGWVPYVEGITISGGEPFDQPDALSILLKDLRGLTSVDVLVYSGYPLSALTDWLQKNPDLIDALITEPYDATAEQTLPIRGSDNQRLHFVSKLGRDRFSPFEGPLRSTDRRLDVMFDHDGTVWLAGIPGKDDFHRLRKMLKAAGHTAGFSDSHSTEVPS